MHETFYGKYNGIFHACTNSVYQASPRGGGGGGGRGLGTRLYQTFVSCVPCNVMYT